MDPCSSAGLPAAIRTSVRRFPRVNVTAAPAGETPDACRGTRTSSAPGNETKRSGGTSVSASPSRPTATGSWEWTSNSKLDHCCTTPKRRWAPMVPRVTSLATPPARRCATKMPSRPVSRCAPGARASKAAHLIRVVRDDDERCVAPVLALRCVEAKHAARCFLPDHVRQHPPPRRKLGVAVLVRLDDTCVDAKRGVVDEDALVERRQVDTPLDPVGERVERADDVVPVETEVEGEVVARAGRDADMGDVMPHGNGGDQRLRAITPRHPDDIGTPSHGVFRELAKVVTGPEEQRFDPAFPRLLQQVEALGLPAARLGIDDQHASLRRLKRSCVPVRCPPDGSLIVTYRVAGNHAEEQQEHEHDDKLVLLVVSVRAQRDERDEDDRQHEQASDSAPGQDEPREEHDEEERHERENQANRIVRDQRDGEPQEEEHDDESRDGGRLRPTTRLDLARESVAAAGPRACDPTCATPPIASTPTVSLEPVAARRCSRARRNPP